MMELIRTDLAALGVRHDVFSSARRLVEAEKVDTVLEMLDSRGLIYVGVLEPPKGTQPDDWEPRPQTLFRASEFGDEEIGSAQVRPPVTKAQTGCTLIIEN